MADGHDVFDAKIKATDKASPLVAKIAASVRGLAPLMKLVSAHSAGMGAVIKAAMGEAEHATHGASHAAHGAAHAIAAAGHAAKHAGPEIEHAAHPRAWLALAAHANLFRSHLGGIRMGVAEIGHSVTEFLPALGALAAGGGLVGLIELTEKVADRFSEMNKAAIGAGMGIAQFQALSLAAKMTDVSVESAAGAMFKLNKVIATAAAGKNKDALALFAHLKLHLREANGHLADSSKLLPELAEAFKRTTDPAMQARMAMALFGKSGKDLLPLLMAGREELEEFSKQSAELNYPFSDADKKNLEGYHRSMIGLNTAVSALGDEIGASLAPVLTPVINMVKEWVVHNRHWIATKIETKVKQLAHWVQQLDFKKIIEDTQAWMDSTLTLGGHVDSLTTIIGAITLALASPLITAVTGAIAVLTSLGRAIWIVNAAMLANPVVLAWLIVAAAVGVVAYEVNHHWDAIVARWQAVPGELAAVGVKLKAPLSTLPEDLAAVWEKIKAPFRALPDELAPLWQKIKGPWVAMWQDMANAARNFWTNDIQPTIDSIRNAIASVENSWIGRRLHLNVEHTAAPGPEGTPMLPGPWGVPVPTDMPQLYGPRAGAAAAAPATSRDGTVRTEITIKGLPPGSTVATSSSGAVEPPQVDVGYSLAGAFGIF